MLLDSLVLLVIQEPKVQLGQSVHLETPDRQVFKVLLGLQVGQVRQGWLETQDLLVYQDYQDQVVKMAKLEQQVQPDLLVKLA